MPPLGGLLKKTVGFLTVSYQDLDHVSTIYGTAFFVFYEDKRLGENQGFGYLVTNRHMAEPQSNGHAALVLQESLRINTKIEVNGLQSADIPLPMGSGIHWYFPRDEAVDLAVIPFSPNQSSVDIEPFPVSMFATKDVVEKMKITEGDSVLFAGFFYQLPGQKKIEPIVRQGVLAMLPDENLTTTRGKSGHLYLADIHVFGGNSGSPLFVNIGGMRGNTIMAGFPFRLLGVVSGYFYEAQDFSLQVATTLSGKANANSGISMVVPVDDLKTLLDEPELQAQRDATVASRAK
jgi:hypothetical protein